MPHQCVGCGNIIPSGDEQILRGCSGCGGKKFFFTADTSQKLSGGEREAIRKKADRDIEQVLDDVFKREKELADALQEGGLMEEEWIKVTPVVDEGGDGVLIEASQGEGEGEGGTAGAGRDTGRKEGRGRRPVKVRVSRKTPVGRAGEPPAGAAEAGEGGRETTMGKAGGRVKGIQPRLSPEVIHMIEPGVYEIDLERLLDKSPIIINKDGTYLIHLPSVMKSS